MHLSMLSPRGGGGGHIWGIWLFVQIFDQIPHCGAGNLSQKGQDFQHILKRISLEIAVFLGFFRNKAISFTFPSTSEISFKFPSDSNFLIISFN